MATSTAGASVLPLPTTLGGASLRITDSQGADHEASLFYGSPLQINFLVPPGVSEVLALLTVINNGQTVATGTVQIRRVAPGLFSANQSGGGVAAGLSLLALPDSSQLSDLLFDPNTSAAVPVSFGNPDDELFLLLFGTGLRGSTGTVTATVGGLPVGVAGPFAHADFAGLDQVNIGPVPRALIGAGSVEVVLFIDGEQANVVTVTLQ